MRTGLLDTSPIRIYLLGRFEVRRGEQRLPADDWQRRKAADLLQRLAFERRLLKEQAIEFLWPNTAPAAGANNLYRTLYTLRQTLTGGLNLVTPDAVFTFADGCLRLNEGVWVDVHEFSQLLAEAAPPVEALSAALDLYQGDLLPDSLYREWTRLPRAALRRDYRDASLTLAAHYRQQGDYSSAVAFLTPLLADDPADEPVHRELMRLYALDGRRYAAVRQYQVCVTALASELDITPSDATEKLHNQILNGDSLATGAAAPVPPAIDLPPSAPLALAAVTDRPLRGREAEVAALQAALKAVGQGQGRTLLLAGDLGSGKTRLAHEGLRLAADRGWQTLAGAAYALESQLPFQPFIEAINRYLDEQQRPLSDNPISHGRQPDANQPPPEQWALFKRVAAFLAGLSQQAPLLLWVDDLHAADAASLALGHYLARQTGHLPLMLLATYRTDLAWGPDAPFKVLLNDLYRESLRIVIGVEPLPCAATMAIVADIWPVKLADSLQQAIAAITEGNPFLAIEIARALSRSDRVEQVRGRWQLRPDSAIPVPAELSELLRQEVYRLGPAVTTTLEAAAVIGRCFSFELLPQLTPLVDWPLLDALDTALAARLIVEMDGEQGGYRFRQALLHRVLVESQSRARFNHLHNLLPAQAS